MSGTSLNAKKFENLKNYVAQMYQLNRKANNLKPMTQ